MENLSIREHAGKHRVPLWMIADEIGVHPNTFSSWLRHELSDERRQKVEMAIEAIVARRQE